MKTRMELSLFCPTAIAATAFLVGCSSTDDTSPRVFLDPGHLSLESGRSDTVRVSVSNVSGTVIWMAESDDPDIAWIQYRDDSSFYVNGEYPGSTIIRAWLERYDASATCSVTVRYRSMYYVAGAVENEDGINVATLWVDGEAKSLGSGRSETFATSVYLRGDDVCVEGFEKDAFGVTVPMLWINGAVSKDAFPVGEPAKTSLVYDGDNYSIGTESNQSGKSVAKLWVNGVAQNLSDGTRNACASSIAVNQVLTTKCTWQSRPTEKVRGAVSAMDDQR
jgi:hypothetical protein